MSLVHTGMAPPPQGTDSEPHRLQSNTGGQVGHQQPLGEAEPSDEHPVCRDMRESIGSAAMASCSWNHWLGCTRSLLGEELLGMASFMSR